MAWELVEEEGEQDAPEGNWKLVEPSFSPTRAAVGLATGVPIGLYTGAASALGGGKSGIVAQERDLETQQYDSQFKYWLDQGLPVDEIEGMIGQRPGELDHAEEYLAGLRGQYAPQTPLERIAASAGETAGEFAAVGGMLPIGGANLASELATGARFGAGSQAAEEAGYGGVGQFLAGVGAGISPWLAKKGPGALNSAIKRVKAMWKGEGKEMASNLPKFLEEAGTPKAMADLELSQRDLVGRTAKLSNEMVEDFEKLARKVGESSIDPAGTFRAAEIEAALLKENQKSILDTVSNVDLPKKEAWESLTAFVEDNFKAAKESYGDLYDAAESLGGKLKEKPTSTMAAAKSLKGEMKGSLLATPDTKTISGSAETLIRKLIPKQGKEANEMVAALAEEGIISDYDAVLEMLNKVAEKEGLVRPIKISDLMKTKRAINRITKKSDLIPAPVDLLKPVARAVKEDIMRGLEQIPQAKSYYEAAEYGFGKTQEVFNNDVIVKMRKTDLPESMSDTFSKPSNLEKLKESLGGEKGAEDLVDRLVVENISNKGLGEAKTARREAEKYLGKKGNEALNKLIDIKDPKTPQGVMEVTRGKVLDDIQKAATAGIRPDYTLNLMKTDRGNNIVKRTLSKSPNGKKVLDSLNRLQMDDIMKSVMDDGVINFSKAKGIAQDPNTRRLIRDAMGEEGLSFFRNLDSYGKNLSENMRRLKAASPSLFESSMDKILTTSAKSALTALTPFTGGKSLLPLAVAGGYKKIKAAKLVRILSKPEGRDAIKILGRKGISNEQMLEAFKKLNQAAINSDGD